MCRDKKLTESQRQEIVNKYAEGVPTKEIADAYGVDQSYVSALANKGGYRRSGKYINRGKTCPNCKAKNPPIAKYCMFCGGDVRDEKQILIEKVEALRVMTVFLPDSARSEADEITCMVLKYLGGR